MIVPQGGNGGTVENGRVEEEIEEWRETCGGGTKNGRDEKCEREKVGKEQWRERRGGKEKGRETGEGEDINRERMDKEGNGGGVDK